MPRRILSAEIDHKSRGSNANIEQCSSEWPSMKLPVIVLPVKIGFVSKQDLQVARLSVVRGMPDAERGLVNDRTMIVGS